MRGQHKCHSVAQFYKFFMANPIIIFGAGILGKVALDIFQSQNILVYGFLDDDTSLQEQDVLGTPVLGSTDSQKILKQIGKKCDAFVASDNNIFKKAQAEQIMTLTKGSLANAIHASVFLPSIWHCGIGNMIGSRVVIGVNVQVGNFCIIGSGAILEADTHIGHYAQVGTGANLGAGVLIGEGAFIGAGAVLVAGVKVGKNARVGAGSVVVQDVAANQTVFGNPAASLKS